jgi:hypothetical protein
MIGKSRKKKARAKANRRVLAVARLMGCTVEYDYNNIIILIKSPNGSFITGPCRSSSNSQAIKELKYWLKWAHGITAK